MSLKERLFEDMKFAMKSRDAVRLSTIRLTLNAIKNKELEQGGELDNTVLADIVSRSIKQRRDSAAQYRQAGREELADKEEAEIAVLVEYLPEQISEEELRSMCVKAVEESGASDMTQIGAVMKLLMPKVKGRADGTMVNKMVKQILGA